MKISVITANYNCKKYIRDCILSVYRQQYPDYEHIIVDDCSRDGSYSLLEKYSKEYPNIKLFSTRERKYCGGAYDFASTFITGDIIGVLDADDCLNPTSMKNISILYKENPDVMYIWTQFWFCNRAMKKTKRGISAKPKGVSLLEAGIKGKHCFSHWRTYRKDLNAKGIFNKKLRSAVDKYMGYKLEELGIGGFIDVPMYYYRQRLGGLSYTGRKNWEKMKKGFCEKRRKKKIKPFPIIELKHENM